MKFNLKRFQAADEKRKAARNYHPPWASARRYGMIAFWGLILLMWLVVINKDDEPQVPQDPKEMAEDENRAANTAGAELAKAFATEYFNWTATPEGWEERRARLAPMLGAGVDEQAGLLMANQEWNSRTVATQILKVQATGEDTALVTVRVEQLLTKQDDPKEKKRQRHTLAVSVAYNNGLGVYDLPAFVGQDIENRVEKADLEGESLDAETSQNIKNFLATFFQSYTTDTPDKLAYFLEDPTATTGLEGTVIFEEVQNMEAVKGAALGEFLVDAEVILRDAETSTGFLSNYKLTIVEKDGRYIVKKLNKGDE